MITIIIIIIIIVAGADLLLHEQEEKKTGYNWSSGDCQVPSQSVSQPVSHSASYPEDCLMF
jgi:hypothetical protein